MPEEEINGQPEKGLRNWFNNRIININHKIQMWSTIFQLNPDHRTPLQKLVVWYLQISGWRRISWFSLRRWGNSRFIKSSYIWIFIIPTVARILEPLPDETLIHVFGNEYQLNLTLPFSWVLLYIMAILFAIAQGIYHFACPVLIKDFANFGEFRKANPGIEYLSNYFIALGTDARKGLPAAIYTYSRILEVARNHVKRSGRQDSLPSDFFSKAASYWVEASITDPQPELLHQDIDFTEKFFDLVQDDEAPLSDVVFRLQEHTSQVNPLLLALATSLFGGGSLIAIYLMIQSFIYTIYL